VKKRVLVKQRVLVTHNDIARIHLKNINTLKKYIYFFFIISFNLFLSTLTLKHKMPVTQHIVNTINKNSEVIQKTLSPHAETLRFITIGTAAALILAYVAFQKFNKPSKSLMHLPYISFFSFIKYAVIKDALFETYSNELVMPLFKNGNNGVYVVKQNAVQ
jgi:hypothetical protein